MRRKRRRWLWAGVLVCLLCLPMSRAAAQESPPAATPIAASESDRARLRAALARITEAEAWRVDFALSLRRLGDRTRASVEETTVLKTSGHFRYGGPADWSLAARLAVFALAEPLGLGTPLDAAIALSRTEEELRISLESGGRLILERASPVSENLAAFELSAFDLAAFDWSAFDRLAESGIAEVWPEALTEFAAVLVTLAQEHGELWRRPEFSEPAAGQSAWQAELDGRQVLLDPRFTVALMELISTASAGRAQLPFSIGPLELSIALGFLYTWLEEAQWKAEFVLPTERATEGEELQAARLAVHVSVAEAASLTASTEAGSRSLQLRAALHWRRAALAPNSPATR